MIPEFSTVVKKLPNTLCDSLLEEIISKHRWHRHTYDERFIMGPLREGRTKYVYDVSFDENAEVTFDRTSDYPNLMGIINDCLCDNVLGKIYCHVLHPGQKIYRHSDSKLPFINKLFKRYQIYLDIPEGTKIVLDDNVVMDNAALKNSLLDFNLKKYHYYENNSDQNLYFFVFDILQK